MTKAHELEMIGKFWIQSVPTLPTWTVDDINRIVCAVDTGFIYFGGGNATYGDWMHIGQIYRDVGTGEDPIDGGDFLGRFYQMKIENGNIILEYEG